MSYTVRHPVNSPPVVARRFGLLSVATEAEGSPAPVGERVPFARGVDYYSDLCNVKTGSLEGWCTQDYDDDIDLDGYAPVRVEGKPHTVTSGAVCVAPAFDAEAAALKQLGIGEAWRAEQLFFQERMSSDDTRWLRSASEASAAIGSLEWWAAKHYGGQPVLHVSTMLIPKLFRERLAVRVGDRIETPWGTPISVGAGYTDELPNVILMTGQVFFWRTDPFVTKDFHARKNEQVALAERTYVFTSDCLSVAIETALCPEFATPSPCEEGS
ncbi:hypothetical protein ABT282_30950 [Streptomyces sp. NPDC000927]|uniref:hypothetical protein n=1 Tax=Streptomyces sp. NPDC000927 TaxID=3154371 RepID=UPI00333277F8